MKRISFLVLVGAITFGVLLFVKRPELFEQFEIWLAGLIPAAIAFFQLLWQKGRNFLKELEEKMFPSKNNEQ